MDKRERELHPSFEAFRSARCRTAKPIASNHFEKCTALRTVLVRAKKCSPKSWLKQQFFLRVSEKIFVQPNSILNAIALLTVFKWPEFI